MKFSDNIGETVELLQEDIKLLIEQADDTLPKPIKVEIIRMPWIQRAVSSEFKKSGYYHRGELVSTVEAVNICLEAANTKLDSEVEQIEELHKTNILAIDNNILIRKKIYIFMAKIGVRETYSTWGYKRSNSSRTTETKHTAGFIKDLDRIIQTNDKYGEVERSASSYKHKLQEYAEKLKKDIFKEQREKDAEEKSKKKLKVVANLCVKYSAGAEAEDYDIRDIILTKDKYLNLAYWLERNRGDWNEGYSFAQQGLDEFTPKSSEDYDIVKDISSYIEDWGGDGRVFRDCEYNYSVLYGMADEVLVKDLQVLQEYMGEE